VPSRQTANLQNSKATNDADARKKIQLLHAQLQSGNDFGNVAASYSEDGDTAPNGGDMGFVAESALQSHSEAYNAITKLKPGEITDVIPIVDIASPTHRTIGYGIYKLISREPAGQRELNDPRVQANIRQTLRETHAQLLRNAYFETLHDDAKVHNYLAEQILKEGAK
jgi:peptidyl-prolyl cis-trans isomerase SurA